MVGLLTYTSEKSYTIFDSRLASGAGSFDPSPTDRYDYLRFAAELESRGWCYHPEGFPRALPLKEALKRGVWWDAVSPR